MNSLSELNNYSDTSIEFVDFRPTDVKFLLETPTTSSTTVYEGVVSLNYVLTHGVIITDIINRTSDLTYSIDLSELPNNPQITWEGLSPTLTLTHTGSVYTVSGIKSVRDWDSIRNSTATLQVPSPFGSVDRQVAHTLTYEGQSKVWHTTIIALLLNELSPSSSFVYADNISNLITGVPIILELGPVEFDTNNYSLTISTETPLFDGSLSSSGVLGGTTSWSSTTGVLTITGDMAQVSSHLSNLYYNAPMGEGDTSILTYSLYNPTIDWTSTSTQIIESPVSSYLSATQPSYYDKNLPTIVSDTTSIIDIPPNPTDQYTLTIAPLSSGVILTIATSGSGGTSSQVGETLTLTGTKDEINARLGTLTLQTTTDYTSNFYLIYTLTTPLSVTLKRSQILYLSNNITSISNLNVNRPFISNTGNQDIFLSNTPQIIEDVTGTPSYTITLNSSAGKFGTNAANATSIFTYTGSKSQVNSLFPTILFYPNLDISSDQIAYYTQSRDGVTQLSNQIVSLVGTPRTTTIPGAGTYTYTSNSVVEFTYEQANYLFADVLIVGGGGGAGATNHTSGRPGAGGGGGVYQALNTHVGVQTTIVVGSKGLAGGWVNNPSYTVQAATNGGNSSITFSDTTLTAYGGIAGGTASSYQQYINGTLHTFYGWSASGSSGSPTNFNGHVNTYTDVIGGTVGPWNGGYPGAGAGGSPLNYSTSGLGGVGVFSSITGNYYGGGGSGLSTTTGSTAGRALGGGGASDWYGGGTYSATSFNALPNTGGGGGTGGQATGPSTGLRGYYGNGADGIVIIVFHA